MNDKGYENSIDFKDSHLEMCIKTSDKEGLKKYLSLSNGAISFHTKENNQSQIEYFGQAVKLINKRLSRKKA